MYQIGLINHNMKSPLNIADTNSSKISGSNQENGHYEMNHIPDEKF